MPDAEPEPEWGGVCLEVAIGGRDRDAPVLGVDIGDWEQSEIEHLNVRNLAR